jgi:hypothetical protein
MASSKGCQNLSSYRTAALPSASESAPTTNKLAAYFIMSPLGREHDLRFGNHFCKAQNQRFTSSVENHNNFYSMNSYGTPDGPYSSSKWISNGSDSSRDAMVTDFSVTSVISYLPSIRSPRVTIRTCFPLSRNR